MIKKEREDRGEAREKERAKGREEGSNGIYTWSSRKNLRWGGKGGWMHGWMDRSVAN